MEDKQELIEIYKLHVEMADRVSQRRLQTNRFYIVLTSGLFTLLPLLANSEILKKYTQVLFISAAILGIILCFIWVINIHSYKQLNTGKFEVITDLEKKLQYPFYTKEWDLLKKGEQGKTYFKLTAVEKSLPFLMIIPYVLLLILSVI